jgi:hypothetical protein
LTPYLTSDLQSARELSLYAVGKLPPEQWDGYVAEACRGGAHRWSRPFTGFIVETLAFLLHTGMKK